ncbi:complex proteins associated with Set1p component shg1-domain-containing protein [Phyllosticta paracitricarpa]|uniref:Complex proteins associated with Set1p component shg1-domain-containing protein n=1 Tax=Phyllosticta paracitricarpa TaxID=2016321 RepID=A0ABR1NAD6_9PEZI
MAFGALVIRNCNLSASTPTSSTPFSHHTMDVRKRHVGDDPAIDPVDVRKRLKTSDLPLTQNKRSAIESILHTFKKKGEFDVLRKKAFTQFENGDAKAKLLSSLEELGEFETTRNPTLLSKDRRIAAPLLEGAAERSEIYRAAETHIRVIIQSILDEQAESKMRDIRRTDIGDEAALDEARRGSKTDEDYLQEAEERRLQRQKLREEKLERQREREREEQERVEEERRRRQEEEEAREREREEREERRRKEREERELERQREYEREREERI